MSKYTPLGCLVSGSLKAMLSVEPRRMVDLGMQSRARDSATARGTKNISCQPSSYLEQPLSPPVPKLCAKAIQRETGGLCKHLHMCESVRQREEGRVAMTTHPDTWAHSIHPHTAPSSLGPEHKNRDGLRHRDREKSLATV